MQGKQAKIVSPTQERAILGFLETTRYPARDRVMFLSSMKAGLRAKEMASLTWAMVTDAAGQVAEVLHVPNRASKGKTGGRTIPLHPDLQAALVMLQTERGAMATPERPILFSERGGGLSPATVRLWFHRLYTSLKMDGCSSHSGRRTFITRAARKVSQVGGSLRGIRSGCENLSLVVTSLSVVPCRHGNTGGIIIRPLGAAPTRSAGLYSGACIAAIGLGGTGANMTGTKPRVTGAAAPALP
jgi:integrase/recombinase XerC